MRLILWLAFSLSFVSPQTAAPPAPAATDSRIWIGRYAEFEDFLRTATFERYKTTEVGVLAPRHGYFAPGGLAAGASVKNVPPGKKDGFWESYKSEIAAYKLDRLLQLDMVPPTIERRIDGQMMSVQLWVENSRMLKEVNAQNLKAPDPARWNFQLHRAYLFDDLVANIDENEGNLLFDPQWNFIKVDHSRAFTDTRTAPFEVGKRLNQIDRLFFDRIKALDKASVKREIGDLLEGGAFNALFARRDLLVKAFEKLAMQKGAGQVFVDAP
jgi:hypothetical protein